MLSFLHFTRPVNKFSSFAHFERSEGNYFHIPIYVTVFIQFLVEIVNFCDHSEMESLDLSEFVTLCIGKVETPFCPIPCFFSHCFHLASQSNHSKADEFASAQNHQPCQFIAYV